VGMLDHSTAFKCEDLAHVYQQFIGHQTTF
jgi:hypothetical protein